LNTILQPFAMILLSLLFCALVVSGRVLALSTAPTRVLVAGAGSRVGHLTIQKLLTRKRFSPVAVVSNKREYKAIKKLGVKPECIHVCDIVQKESLSGIFDGIGKVVVCSSATPKKRLGFRIKNFFRSVFGKPRIPAAKNLYYENGKRPYELDYIGLRHIVDECVKSKVDHVVLLGSMGGYRGSKLNNIGRSVDDADPRNGNTLKWKRAAERYLMKRCYFTIIHAGKLADSDKALSGKREIIWDTDDALLRTQYRRISREDAAEVLVQALIWKEAIGRSIDVACKPLKDAKSGPNFHPSSLDGTTATTGGGAASKAGKGVSSRDPNIVNDWLRFWSRPGNCVYPADFDDLKYT